MLDEKTGVVQVTNCLRRQAVISKDYLGIEALQVLDEIGHHNHSDRLDEPQRTEVEVQRSTSRRTLNGQSTRDERIHRLRVEALRKLQRRSLFRFKRGRQSRSTRSSKGRESDVHMHFRRSLYNPPRFDVFRPVHHRGGREAPGVESRSHAPIIPAATARSDQSAYTRPAASVIPATKRGQSGIGRSCPMPSITSICAPVIFAARSCAAATGTRGSSTP